MKVKICSLELTLLLLYILHYGRAHGQLHKRQKVDNVVAEMQVLCRSDAILLKVNTNAPFNGMVYAKDAPNNSNCMSEFNSSTNMTFRLPLKSCGTLFAEADDGIEYFNTVVVQPHMRLMTNQGKGYHIRCKYQTRERTIANTHFNVSASFMMANNPQTTTTPLLATASMPSCTMKIFRSGRDDVAETVKIGDKLIMVIEIDQQDMYGMKITNCVVRDGLNLAEQQLIDDIGCPIDDNIMPKFEYTNNSTRAAVSFPAHKFPHTSSVYYQCNVRLCINNGGCNLAECSTPTAGSPIAGAAQVNTSNTNGGPRRKRMAHHQVGAVKSEQQASESVQPEAPALPVASALVAGKHQKAGKETSMNERTATSNSMSFDVYSGLYVSDADIAESGSSDTNTQQVLPARRSQHSSSSSADSNTEEICMSLGQTSLLLISASLASVGLVLLISCQVGLFGREQQQVGSGGGKLFASSTCSSLSDGLHSITTPVTTTTTTDARRFANSTNSGQVCRSHDNIRLPRQFYQYADSEANTLGLNR